ncbi:Ras-related protein RabZ [Dirofilaria immitis]
MILRNYIACIVIRRCCLHSLTRQSFFICEDTFNIAITFYDLENQKSGCNCGRHLQFVEIKYNFGNY